jgi:hypothetical protein
MHHTLKIYGRYREFFLKYYIFQAKWTRIPVIGRLVRWVANSYGKKSSSAYLLTLDEAIEIVESAKELALGPCDCRSVFHNCDNPINVEIMIGLTQNIFMTERPSQYQEIDKQKAIEILQDCHQRGLIHTVVRCRNDFYAICNCCSCCCVPLRLNRKYGIGNALIRNPDIVETVKEQIHRV